MSVRSLTAAAGLLALAGCGGDGPKEAGPAEAARAPAIGIDMQSPVDNPFCRFIAQEVEPASTPGEQPYVFVTELGRSVYHGYAKLDGAVTELTEIEAGFGAGMETRRYVNEDESVELEVILLNEQEAQAVTKYTGSVRVIYPVEGEAVKFYGECRTGDGSGANAE